MKAKHLLISIATLFCLVACGGQDAPAKEHKCAHKCEKCGLCTDKECTDPKCSEKCKGHYANIFVLSGQSNMEGNTTAKSGSNDYLANAFQELGLEDSQICYDGIPEVLTSSYCAGYGELDHKKLDTNTKVSCTNKENRFQGQFIPTKVGLGTGTSGTKMGPELGCAYGLREYASEEEPIYFIKMASNGSGFAQSGTDYNWPVKDEDGNFPEINLYSTFLKPFIENNLKLIEEACEESGLTPCIKGWLWHQGESDSADEKRVKYAGWLGDMVAQFREDFADYAVDKDGDNIAFVDGMICESSSWNKADELNAVKQGFADSNEMNFIVDTHGNAEKTAENELKTGSPGGDSMHYNTKSSFRLGMAYAKVIIDNHLI